MKSEYPKEFTNVIIVVSPTYSHFILAPEDLWKNEADRLSFDDLDVLNVPEKHGVYRCRVKVWWDTWEELDQHFTLFDIEPIVVNET